jgi:hypothetical protein
VRGDVHVIGALPMRAWAVMIELWRRQKRSAALNSRCAPEVTIISVVLQNLDECAATLVLFINAGLSFDSVDIA